MGTDFWIILHWWGTLFLVGAVAFPLTKKLFPNWFDQGYLFSKAVGIAIATYLVYLFGILHVAPFTQVTVFVALSLVFIGGVYLNKGERGNKGNWGRIIGEELFFFNCLLFWSWVKGHEPSIHGLEKFMDYGFMKSILNSMWFPAPDMWYVGFPINYYYFGHTVVAVLTKLSGIDLSFTYNLMLATLFAFTATMSFSIGKQLIKGVGGALLTSFLVTLGGNMQTLYAFTFGYTGEDVKPFWQLLWGVSEFWSKLPEGLEKYWYANATRFIPFTIHEFPSYSFVVSDVHGHVLSLPFTLLAIALLIHMFATRDKRQETRDVVSLGFYGLLVAVLLMTNALDGPIYLGLFLILFIVSNWSNLSNLSHWKSVGIVLSVAIVASIPFMLHFSSFVSGVAVNCPPAFLAGKKFGPLLFEEVEKCQHSPFWMMYLLWGFFWYCGAWLICKFVKLGKLAKLDKLLLVFFFFSIALLIFPEFFYFKDIYPAHFRSNTMFKLGYQAFIMFGLISGYAIALAIKEKRKLFLLILIPQLFLVSIYPIFSVRSYFDSLRTYKGLDGVAWLKEQYPDDYEGIQWLNAHETSAVLVEADGDSYTDYERFSAFTGMPTIVGWAVHEWLWRGSYDVVAPRREEVRIIYESENVDEVRTILEKYAVKYIIVGNQEREKFLNLNEGKFNELGEAVFRYGTIVIYRIHI